MYNAQRIDYPVIKQAQRGLAMFLIVFRCLVIYLTMAQLSDFFFP